MLVAMLSGTSHADIVYTTTEGKLGVIEVSGNGLAAPTVKYSDLGNNAFVASYWNGDYSRLIVIDRTTDMTSSGDSALVFSPSNLTNPINGRVTLTGVYNTQAAANSNNGRSIFLASRENASIYEYSTETFNYVHSYQHVPESGDTYMPYMEGVLTDGRSVYGLVDAGKDRSFFLRFDGQLRDDIEDFMSIELGLSVTSMSWLSDSRLCIAHSSGIEYVNRGVLYSIVDTTNPVEAVCQDESNGFYFVTREESGDTYINVLSHYSDGMVTPIRENVIGKGCSLFRDMDNKILAAIVGNEILIYDIVSDELLGEYGSSELSGRPISIAVSYAVGEEEDTSGNSCAMTNIGMVMLMLCAMKALMGKEEE